MSIPNLHGPGIFANARRLPFTICFATAYMCMFVFEAVLLPGGIASAPARFGLSVQTLLDHQYWRVFTALIVPRDPVRLLEQITFIAVMIGIFEWSNGTRRAIGLFFLADVTAKLMLVPLLTSPLGDILSFGNPDVLTSPDVGMSAGGMALLAASARHHSKGWRMQVYIGGLGLLVAKFLLWHQPVSDLLHLMTFNFGWLLAPWFGSPARMSFDQ